MNSRAISSLALVLSAREILTLNNMHCSELKKYIQKEDQIRLSDVAYTDIFSDTEKQLQVTLVFHIILQTRERLKAPQLNPAYPGLSTGPADG